MDQRQQKFVVTPTAKEVTFEHDGEFVKVKYLPITRKFRDEALELAVVAFQKRHGIKDGFSPFVYQNELAKMILVEWSIPSALPDGWFLLTDDVLVDRILKETGIDAALQSLKGRAEEVEKAKNLQ